MSVQYDETVQQYAYNDASIAQCFQLWRTLLLDIVKSKQLPRATNVFVFENGQWTQQEEEQPCYYSPARAKGEKVDAQQEAVYVMGCLLYETIFWKTLWRDKRIRSIEAFIERAEEPIFEHDVRYDAYDETQFILDLLQSMLAADASKRPASIAQVARWLSDDEGNARIYYAAPKMDDVDTTPYVGIDLGTTNTVVVLAKGGQLTELHVDDSLTIPSAVFFQDPDTCYFGKEAMKRGINYPQSLATSFKRHMEGVDGHYPNLYYAVTGEKVQITGMHIAQKFLSWVRKQTMKLAQEPLNHVVVTVPADFDSRKIEATRQAALRAGFIHVGIEREPNAAGYAYIHAERMEFKGIKNIFVYDFGGGTFDVSILQRTGEQSFEIVGRDGNEHLGGDLFNDAITKWLIQQVENEHFEFILDKNAYTDEQKFYNAQRILRNAANEAKHTLTEEYVAKIRLRNFPVTDIDMESMTFELTRDEYEQLIAPYIQQAEKAMQRALKQAAAEKGIKKEHIHDVVLAGGTSLTPAVKQSVESYFGKVSNKALNMSTMISRGAALFAMLKWTTNKEQSIIQQAVTNKATHDFGIAVSAENSGHHLMFKPLIEAGVQLPVSEKSIFTTETNDQEMLQVIIARRSQHERKEPHYFNDEAIEVIDKIVIPDLPRAKAGMLMIHVTFKFDGIGNLSVKVDLYERGGVFIRSQDLTKQVDAL